MLKIYKRKSHPKVGQLLDQIAPMGEYNLVVSFSAASNFTLSEILGIPEPDRQKLVSWMEFLELAQYFTLEQIKQKNEGVSDATRPRNDKSV